PGFFLALPPETPPPPKSAPEVPERAAAAQLLARLTVEPIKDSRLVTISYEDADPKRAQRVLAHLVDIYIEHNVDRVLDSTKTAADWLGVQLEKLRAELSESELALHQYKRDKNILSVSVDDQSNMIREEMRLVNERFVEAQVEIEALQARHVQLTQIDPENPEKLPAPELLQSQVLATFRAQYVAAKQNASALRAGGKGDNHPEVKAAAAEEETLRVALLEEFANIRVAVERSLRAKKDEAKGLAALLERAKQRGLELNRLELEYRRLERSKANTEK